MARRRRPVEEIIRLKTGEDPREYLRARAGTMSARAISMELEGAVSHVAILSLLRAYGLRYNRGHWAPVNTSARG